MLRAIILVTSFVLCAVAEQEKVVHASLRENVEKTKVRDWMRES